MYRCFHHGCLAVDVVVVVAILLMFFRLSVVAWVLIVV